ncbi:hypothetical protein HYH03_009746 [Edaphochlamys debaryana]|uniref:Uncharacterized protein n=1 Tax=Edaphochlamys debaryana TaxID=47281 RepID=A0A835XVQ9_9CHLO|nr:hypothetical protein HYH03_009746 [Edaphochlamys debaryana]|eukprot:KAG2492017.1 hypothetical protein HYH03_009746 [Edaphochlamys debaryana]
MPRLRRTQLLGSIPAPLTTTRKLTLSLQLLSPDTAGLLAAKVPSLEELVLPQGWGAVPARAVAQGLRALLRPTGSPSHIPLLTSLRRLELGGDGGSGCDAASCKLPPCVCAQAVLSTLEELSLHLDPEDAVPCVSQLARMTQLKALSLHAHRGSSLRLSRRPSWSQVRRLLDGNGSSPQWTDSEVLSLSTALAPLIRLRSLGMFGDFTSACLAMVAQLMTLPGLQELSLAGAVVEADSLERLTALTRLEVGMLVREGYWARLEGSVPQLPPRLRVLQLSDRRQSVGAIAALQVPACLETVELTALTVPSGSHLDGGLRPEGESRSS